MTDMKLSAAIREGARLRPQMQGKFFHTNPEGTLCSCALGAAWEADTGQTDLDLDTVDVATLWPELYFRVPITPLIRQLHDEIKFLNDVANWSREAIADQVEAWGY